jgi:hypothetical protein
MALKNSGLKRSIGAVKPLCTAGSVDSRFSTPLDMAPLDFLAELKK